MRRVPLAVVLASTFLLALQPGCGCDTSACTSSVDVVFATPFTEPGLYKVDLAPAGNGEVIHCEVTLPRPTQDRSPCTAPASSSFGSSTVHWSSHDGFAGVWVVITEEKSLPAGYDRPVVTVTKDNQQLADRALTPSAIKDEPASACHGECVQETLTLEM